MRVENFFRSPLAKLSVIVCWLVLVQSHPFCLAQNVSLEDITQAWSDTQNKVKTGVFEFSTRQDLKGIGIDPPDEDLTGPIEDVTLRFQCKFYFKGSKLRFEKQGPFWSLKHNDFVDKNYIYVWDGEKDMEGSGHSQWPAARPYGKFPLINNTFRPLLYAFRMNEPSWYIFKPDRYQLNADEETRIHKLLRSDKVREDLEVLTVAYLIDERKTYSIINYSVKKLNGDSQTEFDMGYKFDSRESLWVPFRWSVLDTYTLEKSLVTNYRLNIEIEDSLFENALPANTFASDERKIGTSERDNVFGASGEKP